MSPPASAAKVSLVTSPLMTMSLPAVSVVSVAVTVPLIVKSVPAVTSRVPDAVTSPNVKSLTSLRVTFTPSALTVPLKSLAWFRVMSPPATKLVGPSVTVKVPLAPWVMLPLVAVRSRLATLMVPSKFRFVAAVASKLPVAVTSPSVRLLMSLMITFTPLALTVPLKSLALSSTMSPPATRLLGPLVTVKVPLVPWVMLPAVAVKSKLATLMVPFSFKLLPAVPSSLPVATTLPRFTLPSATKVMLRQEPLFTPVKLVKPFQLLTPIREASWF